MASALIPLFIIAYGLFIVALVGDCQNVLMPKVNFGSFGRKRNVRGNSKLILINTCFWMKFNYSLKIIFGYGSTRYPDEFIIEFVIKMVS